jgi:hypothetical protein
VTPVPPIPAAIAAFVLFFVPGLVFLSLLPRDERDKLPWDEALFLVTSTSVMASAWVALLLAEAGRFHLLAAAALLGGLSALVLVAFRKAASTPIPGGSRAAGPAALVLVLALALQARPSEYLFGGRDPGTYVAAMCMIGRTGGILYRDPGVLSIPKEDVELFFRNPNNPDFSWGRFMGFPLERPETGRVFPEFFHLFPAFGAYLFEAMGVKGALATPPIFGILGTLAVFFAVRRLFGEAPALLAALLLSLNVIQVWFARYPVSELLSQFLVFVTFLALSHWEEDQGTLMGCLAGAGIGLSLLVRIDGVLLLIPLIFYLVIRRASGGLSFKKAAPILAVVSFLLVHAAIHATFWSRKYLVDIANRKYWRQSPAALAGAALFGVVALVLWRRFGKGVFGALLRHEAALRRGLIVGVTALALYAYFLRPSLSAWAGGDGNDPSAALLPRVWAQTPGPGRLWAFGVLKSLGFARLAAHDAQAFLRLGWFVSPLGLLLGVLGLLLALRRWRSAYLFPLLTTLTFSLFYFYKIRVYNDYYFALRRFAPVSVPCLLAFAAFFLGRMAARGGPGRLGAGALALLLGGLYVRGTLPIVSFVDWKNAVRFVDDLARHFGPDDVVIFEQPRSIHLLSLPLWAVHNVNALELARFNPDPERLRSLVRAWRNRYRNIYFVHTYSTDLCGVFLERVQPLAFGTFEWERAYGRPPQRPEWRSLRFTISRVVLPEELQVPPLPEVDIGGSDDVQVSGFFEKEQDGERTYRWTGTCASVFLPGAKAGATVVITASANKRPSAPEVRVSLSGVPLGSFTLGSDWEDHALTLPPTLPLGPLLLRLDVSAWRPAKVLPGSTDTRDLGVMVDRIRIEKDRGASQGPPRAIAP